MPQHSTPPSLILYEKILWAGGSTHVAGVDEVGVGPLAGPVVAAAVILPPYIELSGINDSKKLSAKKRLELAQIIYHEAVAVGLGLCTPSEIDVLNILQASREAMRRALLSLRRAPQHLLVDGRNRVACEIPQTTLVGGDGLSQSIGAASIVAKVARDRLMQQFDVMYPGYGFVQNMGYPTPQHLAALNLIGPCPLHRRSFAPVAECFLSRAKQPA
jgi:ribonuclease HII